MHASLHHVTTAILVVGIIACVVWIIIVVAVVAGPIESSDEESSSVMESGIESAALETIGCEAATLHNRNSSGTDRSRAREAAVKATAMECASSCLLYTSDAADE